MPRLSDLLGALQDPQFYRDAGNNLLSAFRGGVEDITPTGAGPIVARNFGVKEDPKYRDKITDMANFALTFIGKNAKTWNPDTNAAAVRMDQQHALPADIWRKTGNMKGPDNQWRQEISDHASRMFNPQFDNGPLGAFLDHPELYKAYPDFQRYPTQLMQGGGGAFSPRTKELFIGAEGPSLPRSVALHETQHAAQSAEGFARGGNLDEFWPAAVQKLQQQYPRVDVEAHPQLRQLAEILQKNYYKRLAGEAEARLTQRRMNLTPEERLLHYPGDTTSPYGFDVPLSELLVKR